MKNIPRVNIRNEWLLFWGCVLLTVLISSGVFLYMQHERERDIASLSSNYTVRIEALVNRAFHKSDIFKSIVIMNDGQVSQEQFNELAASIYDNTPGIRAMQLLPNGVVSYCYPMAGNEKAIGLNIMEDPRRAVGLQVVLTTHDMVLLGPYVLTQGGLGVIATNPIYLPDEDGQDRLWGFAVIVLDMPEAIEPAALSNIKDRGYDYQIYSINELGERLIIAGNPRLDIADAYESTLELPHNNWTLALKPTYAAKNNLLLLLVFFFGLIISGLLAYAYRAGIRAKEMQAKSQLMSRVSHELRTPMNAIIGFSNLGREADNADDMKFYLTRISESTEYLLGLINDVLDMGGLLENKITLQPTPYRLRDFKRWLNDMFRVQALQKKLLFDVILEDDNDWAIVVDRSRFEQIAANLVDNAISYTPMGGAVSVRLKIISQDSGMAKISLRVKDTGIGIDRDFQTRMFEPFEQEDKSKTSGKPGNGLGLAIVKKLVELMRGYVICRSAKDQGTEFIVTMTVPLLAAEEAEKKQQQKDYSGLVGKHILLAEDHPINVKIAVKLLQRQGMTVDTAANGQQAVDIFRQSPLHYYDAVLMDIRMPILDGLGAARAIRELERDDARLVPIIAVTANAYVEDSRKSYAAGMNAHLAKPVDAVRLYDTLTCFILNENCVK